MAAQEIPITTPHYPSVHPKCKIGRRVSTVRYTQVRGAVLVKEMLMLGTRKSSPVTTLFI